MGDKKASMVRGGRKKTSSTSSTIHTYDVFLLLDLLVLVLSMLSLQVTHPTMSTYTTYFKNCFYILSNYLESDVKKNLNFFKPTDLKDSSERHTQFNVWTYVICFVFILLFITVRIIHTNNAPISSIGLEIYIYLQKHP